MAAIVKTLSFIVLLALVTACGGGQEKPEAASTPAAPPAEPIDPATVASISGRITLEGTPPKPERIKTT